MIKHFTTTVVLVLYFSFGINAQNFYYAPEGKAFMKVSTEQVLIQFQPDVGFETQKQILSSFEAITPLTRNDLLPAPQLTIAKLSNVKTTEAVDDLLKQLMTNDQILRANHFLVHKDGTLHGVTNRVLVRLKNIGQYDAFALAMKKNPYVQSFVQNEFEPLLMEVKVQGEKNALEVANLLHESGVYDYAEPDFLRIMKRLNTNDPNVDDQWSLNNDGVNTAQYNGVPGADMSVFAAWATTTGSASIKVAILDEGVDLNHPDLAANLLAGYDATGQNSGGGPSGNDAHGTACAGIVAAVGNNNLGGAGVAYSSKIIPVRIAYSQGQSWITTNAWIGNSINWSYQNANADILSNSWGGGGSSSTINNAISGAVNNGRNGLGAPVLFAAGNDNGANSYPATYAPTISVIAMSMCNQRKNPASCDGESWWGSNYGNGADVAAPGVKIFATDISGSAGYSNGDYTASFNGTSSACPNAAGVMALILSADNSLTETQARFALESTTDKVGGYTYNNNVNGQPNGSWSNDLGYGRVNADAAVASVASTTANDAGITSVIAPTGTVCATSATPQVALRNFGSNTLTSVTINYSWDNGANNTYNWTGSLPQGSTTTVTLPAITFGNGSHIFEAATSSPNGQADENTNNDQSSSSFTSGSNALTLTIVLDNYPEETSWEVRDAADQVVVSGGTYGNFADGSTVTENLCFADGCFDFIIYDAYGDGICCGYGNGSYALVEDASGTELASGGNFGSSETTNFCVPTTAGPIVNVTIGSSTNVSCNGGSGGSATAVGSGGTGTITYSWSSGTTGATATGLSVGTYTVTATDGNTSATASVVIAEPDAITGTITGTNATNGNNNGTAEVINLTGGTPPYSYLWSNGATTAAINNLAPGNYDVTVSDDNGCQATGGIEISNENTGGGCTYQTIDANGFESGWGIWNDGGSDCRRRAQDAPYAYSGSRCIRLRDNTNSSVMTTDNLDLATYEEITVDFAYYPRSMDNSNEDFWLQISTNGGTSYTTVEEWNRGDEFENNNFYTDQVIINGPFSSDTRFRFRCDASGNSDWVYIDEVVISGCNNASNGNGAFDKPPVAAEDTPIITPDDRTQTIGDLKLFPNPTNSVLNVSFNLRETTKVQMMVISLTGQVLQRQAMTLEQGEQKMVLEADDWNSGVYFVYLVTDDQRVTKRFVVAKD
ncbi:MAG: S8 family serine peptidase [Bacteroidota bacterium]